MRRLRSVLVTGGAGFIGSAVVRHLLRHRDAPAVITLDALTYAGSRDHLVDLPHAERHTFVHADVNDRAVVQDLLRQHRVDTILHLAAESHVDRSIDGPDAFLRTNLAGTQAMLEAARTVWLDEGARPEDGVRFHQVSTDEVYGDLAAEAPPSVEGDPYRPSSPYSASKAGADHLVRAWARTYGLPVSISLGSNTYGPRQYPEKLIPVVVRRALAGAPIPIYGDGRQVRDWLHVDDHAAGIVAVATAGATGRSYNLGGANPRVNLELARRICGVLDRSHPAGAPHDRLLTFVDDRPGHDRRYALDISRAGAELGWSPRVDFEAGLAATVAWFAARHSPGGAGGTR